MTRSSCAVFLVILLGSAGFAQSTVTLDSFDLDMELKPKASGGLGDCLLDPEACESSEYRSSTKFTLDDVVNIGIIDREEAAESARATGTASTAVLPSIDMEILFDYDSDVIRPDQYAALDELAELLKAPRFASYNFIFLGHTDAKGSEGYNTALSQRRAESVSRYVAQVSDVGSNRMLPRGLGFSHLKTPDDPLGDANRRVQLVLVPR